MQPQIPSRDDASGPYELQFSFHMNCDKEKINREIYDDRIREVVCCKRYDKQQGVIAHEQLTSHINTGDGGKHELCTLHKMTIVWEWRVVEIQSGMECF